MRLITIKDTEKIKSIPMHVKTNGSPQSRCSNRRRLRHDEKRGGAF